MAITRGRLAFHVPWGRGAERPIDRSATAVPDPVTASTPFSAATPPRRRRMPERGPDGRFVRRAADPAGSPTTATTAVAAPAAQTPPAVETPRAIERLPAVERSFAAQTPPVAVPSAAEWPAAEMPTARRRLATIGLGGAGAFESESLTPRPIRLVLVEDVADVAVHVREMLRSQSRFKLVHVIADGRRAAEQIADLQPDVVLVDSLLQGRTSGRAVVERLRASGSRVGIVALTVPEHRVDPGLADEADSVVTLPFGTYDLGRGIIDAHNAATARDPSAGSRIVTVFAAKGGVGKTTIAYNLAVVLARTGLRTLLLDGSLQFGDVRRLLRADAAAPSICDLPTDFVRGSDLADTVVSDPSGVDVLLAPPRPELAELVTGPDLEQVLDVLRRAYQAIVVDTPSTLSEPTLAMLDAADLVIDVLTADPAAIDSTRMITATFAEIGYPPTKVRYLVNRADAVGAVSSAQVARAIGREPDYAVASDWQLVSTSNAEGVPYVLARPDARASVDLRRVADDVRALAVVRAGGVAGRRGRVGR